MFEFIHGLGKNKELETIVQEIDSNIANNYKDAAQEAFVLLEQKFQELSDKGQLRINRLQNINTKSPPIKKLCADFRTKTRNHIGIPKNDFWSWHIFWGSVIRF